MNKRTANRRQRATGTIPLGPTILGTAQGIPALAGGVADSVTFTPLALPTPQ